MRLTALAMLLNPATGSAQNYEAWNGSAWVRDAIVSYSGPVKVSYLGLEVNCRASWQLRITQGYGSFTAVRQDGNVTCNGTTPSNLPWAASDGRVYTGANPPFAGAPVMVAPMYEVEISGVRIFVPSPINVTCPSSTGSGTIKALMDSGGGIVFKSTLGACTFQTQPGGRLVPDVPIRFAWL